VCNVLLKVAYGFLYERPLCQLGGSKSHFPLLNHEARISNAHYAAASNDTVKHSEYLLEIQKGSPFAPELVTHSIVCHEVLRQDPTMPRRWAESYVVAQSNVLALSPM